MADDFRYTIEGEKLTKAEIVARVVADHPRLKPDTIRKRLDKGVRTWKGLSLRPEEGSRLLRNGIKSAVHRLFQKKR